MTFDAYVAFCGFAEDLAPCNEEYGGYR